MAASGARGLKSCQCGGDQACWHKDLVNRCWDACLTALTAGGVTDVAVIDVPGSFEIPLQAKRCADQGRYDAIIAMGLVVDGGIYAYEFVGQAVIDGLMPVQLASGIPVLSAVLTPRAFHESDAHQTFFHAHLALKGQGGGGLLVGIGPGAAAQGDFSAQAV